MKLSQSHAAHAARTARPKAGSACMPVGSTAPCVPVAVGNIGVGTRSRRNL